MENKDDTKSRKSALAVRLKAEVMTPKLCHGDDQDEARLSKAFGLWPPLREVFRHMAGLSYLELRESRGAWVSPRSYATLRSSSWWRR
ncbi:transcriptional regulator, GntR family [Ruegeria lacuscaerulensis ITI-1157]|nr:transcriptional regulator, GntR family [Ruegeria lacuscaerulensis ITI-1157]